MIRIATIFILILTLLLLLKSGISTWQYNPLPVPPEVAEGLPEPITDKSIINFFHEVPQPLPDLHKNYLFNVDRVLEIEEEAESVDEQAGTGTDIDVDVDIENVNYVGSIITKDVHKAIISYTLSPPRGFASRRRTTRGPAAPPRGAQASSNSKHEQLKIGDTFSGYKVTVIDPDKIVFEREGEKVEKFLHDPAKKRDTPSLAAAAPTGKAAPAQPPQPAGSRMITVGKPQEEVEEGGARRSAPRAVPSKATRQGIPSGTTRMRPPTDEAEAEAEAEAEESPITRRRPRFVPPPGQPPPSGSTTGE
jgi:hypothetical protein